ncbi:hypothetical protein [Aeromonas bestiarum]|uniref:SMODS-associating 2TM beta-strand rich effector domain-containing protein n=1 Tax=Aeromonas bestiarum TaxID=105751 RepID=A0ABT7Q1D5_9GAMM|nr:hypothetical protein [Aeromonas bestiarum]MDM5073147.1 hypothetical protein [Aeromonas bestiarum]
MNPLDKITDPTFTNSAKGLLTLFCIGVFHFIIGINLIGKEITIPWLPSISFENTERLTYIYWGLVGFTMYRYTLHNAIKIKKHYFFSLYNFFRSDKSGKTFINENIYSEKFGHQIELVNDENSLPKITIKNYQHGDHDWELMGEFSFQFTKSYSLDKIIYLENPAYTIDSFKINNISQKEKWGLTTFIDDDNGSESMESSFITDRKLRYNLRIHVLFRYFKNLTSNEDIFDLLTPLLLNGILFLICSITTIVNTSSP